ncbi:MAG: Major capsid protein N4-gp56 family [Polaromonas sp.]|nr:Major capsid protein N4-gp56 family [Polaromonas sp.]
MPTTTITQVVPGVQAFYDRNLLSRAQPNDVHGRFGQKRPIATRSGNQIKFRRYSQLAAATTALTEGVTPTGSSLAVTDITSTLAQYGDFITLSDLVSMVNQDAVVTEATDVLGDQAGTTIDLTRRDVLVAGSNVAYATAAANRLALVTKLTGADLDKAIRFLKNQNAKFMKEGISPTDNVGTGAIRKAFIAIVHPDVEFDLEAISGFRAVSDYGSQQGVIEDEIGAYKNIRFVTSTNAKVWTNATTSLTAGFKGGSSNDVYATLILAAESYGVSPLSGQAMNTYVKALGSAGTADPLEQRSTVGWKATTVTTILNQTWLIRIESLASA